MNKNHAPAGAANGAGGQFVSADDASSQQAQAQTTATAAKKKAPVKKKAAAKKKATGQGPRVKKKDEEYEALAKAFGSKFGVFMEKLNDFSQSSEVGFLSTPQEITGNIGKILSKNVVSHIDRLYGQSTNCSSYQFHPKSNPHVNLNIFTCVLGKYRFKSNHAHFVDAQEYDKMQYDPRYEKVYRGITSTGEKRRNILNGYTTYDINNVDIYGNGIFGTNVYTTTRYTYASGYAYGDSGIIYGLVAKDAKTCDSVSLNSEKSTFIRRYGDEMKSAVKKAFENGGVDSDRAQRIADSFVKSVQTDVSLYALIKGYDYQISDGHQRNILNLNKWYIRREQ